MNSVTKKQLTITDLSYISLFVAIITVCSWISIPLAVPFTMQTFAIYASVGLLGTKRSALSMLIYISLGAIGVPVFANFSAGIGVLVGTTGGYILGYLLSIFITGGLIKLLGKRPVSMFFSMVVGLIVCYFFGTVWFIYLYAKTTSPIGIMSALSWCVFPFIIPDLLKILLAIVVVKRVEHSSKIIPV